MNAHPSFQWRVHIKGVGFKYYAFYSIPREPFKAPEYCLITRDAITESTVGVYTMAQYENRVSDIISRPDCELV